MKKYIVYVLLAISIFFNVYLYGYRWIYQRGFQAGANMVSNSVAQQFKDTGKVKMMYEGKAISLAPERQVGKINGDVNKMFE